MPRSSAHATVTSSKSKVCVRRHTRHLTILPLLQFVPRPFRVRSAPYFVVSTPRLSSIRSALEIANRTVGPSSASPSSSRHPTTALHPTPRPVYLRIRCNVAQMTVAIVTTDRALACATPITATSSVSPPSLLRTMTAPRLVLRPFHPRSRLRVVKMTIIVAATDLAPAHVNRIAATSSMSSSPPSHFRLVSRLTAHPFHGRSSSRLVRTALSIAAIRRAIVHANRTAAKQYLGPTALQHSEPTLHQAFLRRVALRPLCATRRARCASDLAAALYR